MPRSRSSKAQLVAEVAVLRQRLAELEGVIHQRPPASKHQLAWSSRRSGEVTARLAQEMYEHQRTEALLSGENTLLELIAKDASLAEVLTHFVQIIEAQAPGMRAAVQLVAPDGSHLRHGAAPSLPDSYNQAVDGMRIGPEHGSCGTAAYRTEPVMVTDIASDPLWTAYRDVALAHGLRACRSTPIVSSTGRLLGTFALYSTAPKAPTVSDRHLMAIAVHLARLAIERAYGAQALKQSEEQFRSLIIGSIQGILIHREFRPLFVNKAWAAIHGYTMVEILQMDNVMLQVVASHDQERLQAYSEARLHGRRAPSHYEYQAVRKDGTRIWLESVTTLVTWNGMPAEQSTIIDVTERRHLEQQLLTIAEREQQRIGVDLHDGLGQLLTGIAFLTKGLARQLAAQSLPGTAEAAHIVDLVNQAIGSTRSLARGLYPAELQTHGLRGALRTLAEASEALFGISCKVVEAGGSVLSDPDTAIHLYRIAQESIHNAVKHGHARDVQIRLRTAQGRLTMTVRDNGVGMPAGVVPEGSMGIRIMHYRARMIGATLSIQPAAGSGTEVTCVVPLWSRDVESARPYDA